MLHNLYVRPSHHDQANRDEAHRKWGVSTMTRAIIKFKNGDHLNIQADCIDLRDGWVMAWRGDLIVAFVRDEVVDACYLSEKKEGCSENEKRCDVE